MHHSSVGINIKNIGSADGHKYNYYPVTPWNKEFEFCNIAKGKDLVPLRYAPTLWITPLKAWYFAAYCDRLTITRFMGK